MHHPEAEHTTFAYYLFAPRTDYADSLTLDEARAMAEHFDYLKRLEAAGKLIFAGRPEDLKFPALVVFRAGSMAEAEALLKTDPAVANGFVRGEVSAFQVVLPAQAAG